MLDKPEVRHYRVGTMLKNHNSKLTVQVPTKGILLSKPVPPPSTSDGKVTSLDELPTEWWSVVDNASGGYQYKTLTEICGARVETMLDGCAGSNHVTEELVCGMLNKAKEMGLKPDDPKFPVVQMERWVHAEAVHGIAASSPVPLKGAVVMRVTLLEGFTPEDCKPSHEILVRAKISAKGRSDWHGLILGGRSLDCQSRGGLGFRPGPTTHMLDTLGIGMPRVEHIVQRPDRAYVARSVISSLDSCVWVAGEEAKEVLVLDSQEVLELGPDDGALVPVKRVSLTAGLGKDLVAGARAVEALLPVEGKVEAVPGMWPSGSCAGHALVMNPSEWDSVLLEPGEPVAEIQRGHASMSFCDDCGTVETLFETKGSRGQSTVRRSAAEDSVGCARCDRSNFAVPVQEMDSPEGKRTRSQSLNGRPSGLAPWLLVSCIAALAATCTRSLHIVEKYGVVERLAQGSPTAAYYEALRADLGSRHRHLVDHMVSLEAFLDRSIIVGFSFGVNKALVAAVEGKLLGHTISRSGCRPDPERTQAVRDFPPLKEKVHVQQFLGCANWLRIYLPSEFAHAAKVLGEFQKPGAKFPDQGLGPGDTPGDKAVRAIKEMMTRHIMLNVFDEAAAVSGRCPLEQIADASGIAVGGTVVQMSRDLSRFKVLLTHSKGLTPAQQAWPPLTLEAFAQLEVRRAAKKALGTVRSILWTDHANLTRAQVGDVDVKLLRWVSELVADGSEIRSLAGRSAKLGDGFSRNPPNRDALLDQRTKDLKGLSGQLRGFDLDEFLGNDTGTDKVVPWTVGDDAVPDRFDRVNAVSRSIPTRQKAAVVYVHDYRPEKEERQALSNLEEVLKKTLPGMETGLYSAYGPFEDDVGIQCHFDGSRMFLAEQKRIKGLRVDILTSLATLSRLVAQFCPEIVVGSGQGGLVAMCLTKPLVLELMLQMRNVQREEAHRIAEAWGKVRVVVAQRPAFGRVRPLLEYFEKCCPEFFKEFPVEGPELFVVLGRTSSRHDEIKGFLDRWGVAVVRSLEDVPLAGSLDRPAKEMFAHEGTCPCGKRTYLFGRCPSCIKKEADEELEQVLEEEMPNAGKGGLEEALDKELEAEILALDQALQSKTVRWMKPSQLVEWSQGSSESGSGNRWIKLPGSGDFVMKVVWKKGSVLPKVSAQPGCLVEGWIVRSSGVVGSFIPCGKVRNGKELESLALLPWDFEGHIRWDLHQLEVQEFCTEVKKKGQHDFRVRKGKFGPLDHLFAVLGDPSVATCLGSSGLGGGVLLARFQLGKNGKWRSVALPGGHGSPGQDVVVYGTQETERKILLLASKKWILTDWMNGLPREVYESIGVAEGEESEADQEREREGFARDLRADYDLGEFRVSGSLRAAWYQGQRADPNLKPRFDKLPSGYRLATDGLLEKRSDVTGPEKELWVPVVPPGNAYGGCSWRRACFDQVHCGWLGGHRNADKTLKLLQRVVYWDGMQEDVVRWVKNCGVCLRWRSQPKKLEAKAVKTLASTCWAEVVIDIEGPNPADQHGYRYILTYLDALSHGVLLEPLKALTREEVRRAFSRCVFRSRTLPEVVRTDRGQEFTSAVFSEYVALLGSRQKFSTPLRPCEMGRVERVHQELQKLLGILLKEVVGDISEWSEALCVVEFLIDNTPASHGFTPRDLDRGWSLGLPLERELLRDVLQHEEVSEYARRVFGEFTKIRSAVVRHWDYASEARARLANKGKRKIQLEVGDKVMYRDPRSRSGGRTPWKKELTGPWQVISLEGNRLVLRLVAPTPPSSATSSSQREVHAHAEDVVLLPKTQDFDMDPEGSPEPVRFEESTENGPRSLTDMRSKPQSEFTVTRRGRPYVIRLGDMMAYQSGGQDAKICKVGRTVAVAAGEGTVTLHKYGARTGGLRVRWAPVYLTREGEESFEHSDRPSLDVVTIKRLITKLDINADGVLDAAGARRLDKGGYRLSESTLLTHCCGEVAVSALRADSVLNTVEDGRWDLLARVGLTPDDGEKGLQRWLASGDHVDFLEIFSGVARLSAAARGLNLSVAPSVDRKRISYMTTMGPLRSELPG